MSWDESGSAQSTVAASAVLGEGVPRGHLPGTIPPQKGSCQETPHLGWRPSSSPAGGRSRFTRRRENQESAAGGHCLVAQQGSLKPPHSL